MLSPQITFHQMEVIINHSFQKKKKRKKNQPLISLFSSQSRVESHMTAGERVVLVAGH